MRRVRAVLVLAALGAFGLANAGPAAVVRRVAPATGAVGAIVAGLAAPLAEVVTPAPSAPPPAPPPASPSEGAVTLAFGGDIHFEGVLRNRLAEEGDAALAPAAALFTGADLVVANLETAVTERGEPEPKQFTFRTGPAAFGALAGAGIHVASMANNHGMDYGPVGLEDSLAAAASAGYPIVGIGRDAAQAYAPYVREIRGQQIAVIGASQVIDAALLEHWSAGEAKPGVASAYDEARLAAAVEAAHALGPTTVVVVFLHWGTETVTCPTERQRRLADRLVAAGADVVVGGHAHRVLAAGFKAGAVVGYGLGNFAFYTAGGPGAVSGVLKVVVAEGRAESYSWSPARLSRGVAPPLSGREADRQHDAWRRLRACSDLTD
ncbi:MAG: CapA family protein [Acidimicrobiales bacterium]